MRVGRGASPAALAGAAAFALPLAVYLRTLARGVTATDSGELAAAAVTLGIAHPPGYPLFTLLGHATSWLPLGAPAWRVGLVSALAAAGASWLVWRLGLALLRPRPGEDRGAAAAAPWAALAGGLLFAFARTTWSQATIVEVYALQALLDLLVVAAALGAARAAAWPAAGLRAVGFTFGLALTNHLGAVLLLPTVVVALALAAREHRWGLRGTLAQGGRAVPWALLPLGLYLYLPLRSRLQPAIDWDHPDTWHRFWMHVSAQQFHGLLGDQGWRGQELGRFLARQLPDEATWLLPALALLGLAGLVRRRMRAVALTAPIVVAVLAYNAAYPIPDISVYYLPVVAVLALWAGVGAGWLAPAVARAISRAPTRRPVVAAAAAAALAALALLLPARNFATLDRSRSEVVSRFVRDALRHADPGAVIFSDTWERFSGPALYVQHVERVRPDVVVLDMGRLGSPTLGRDLGRTLPDVAEACAPQLTAMAAAVARFERGEPGAMAEAGRAFQAARQAVVAAVVTRRPTYALGGAFRHPSFRGLHPHPEGLLVRLTTDAAFRPIPEPALEGPGVAPGDLRDEHEREIWAEYVRMADGRAQYLRAHGAGD